MARILVNKGLWLFFYYKACLLHARRTIEKCMFYTCWRQSAISQRKLIGCLDDSTACVPTRGSYMVDTLSLYGLSLYTQTEINAYIIVVRLVWQKQIPTPQIRVVKPRHKLSPREYTDRVLTVTNVLNSHLSLVKAILSEMMRNKIQIPNMTKMRKLM